MNMPEEHYLNVKCRLHGANLSRDASHAREHNFPSGAHAMITSQIYSGAYINVLLGLQNVICSNLTSI